MQFVDENINFILNKKMRLEVKEKSVVLISTLVILSALGFMFAASPSTSTLKIGYVNSATILDQIPEAQAGSEKTRCLDESME